MMRPNQSACRRRYDIAYAYLHFSILATHAV
jgi:hypothetical protein